MENLFYDDWTDEQKADIDNELFRAGCDGTYHYEIPLFSGTFGIMYRKDLFEEFGIKAEDIKTWEDLVKAAQTLTYVNDAGLRYGATALVTPRMSQTLTACCPPYSSARRAES